MYAMYCNVWDVSQTPVYSSTWIVCDKVEILQALIPIPNTKATRRTLDVVESGARVDFGSRMTVQIDIKISFTRAIELVLFQGM